MNDINFLYATTLMFFVLGTGTAYVLNNTINRVEKIEQAMVEMHKDYCR